MINIEEFQPKSVSLGETKKAPSGGCYTPLLVDNQSMKLKVCTAEGMRLPFGINASYSGGDTLTMPLVPTPEFEEFAGKIDAVIPSLVESRALELFGQKKNVQELRELYKPLIHLSKNQEYSNTVHVKIRPKTQVDIATCDGYVRGTIDDIVRGSRVLLIVKLGSVWVQDQKAFGANLEAFRVVVHLPPTREKVEDLFPVRPMLPPKSRIYLQD